MGNDEFEKLAKSKVVEYHNESNPPITLKDVYVTWSSKTLQNNKAMLSTTVSDGMYYEVTYNGDKHELYFDAYKKQINIKYDI